MATIICDDGVRLDFTRAGDPSGRPVVLLAGFRAPATSWMFQISPLADAGYNVISVDLRGHGAAGRPKFGLIMERRGHDVAQVLSDLDLTDVLIVGGRWAATPSGPISPNSVLSALRE